MRHNSGRFKKGESRLKVIGRRGGLKTSELGHNPFFDKEFAKIAGTKGGKRTAAKYGNLNLWKAKSIMTYEVYKDQSGEWRWKLVAQNGKIIADSSEGYQNKLDCKEMIHTINKENQWPIIEVQTKDNNL